MWNAKNRIFAISVVSCNAAESKQRGNDGDDEKAIA
jgi:hypothetical protein